ncbi:MAG TPA: lysophospholipid acyltransferase family protein [Rugosibacter sp.]|nr:lysophospholipid acyltransferase family protein [Rugosibacter sp.]HQN46761.1 lysophospholipid acyltransferase family protein [Rugosibacter sp.]HQQ35861.1 lysophospholipid acyltransferase family protein [Rugosibacter sp.]
MSLFRSLLYLVILIITTPPYMLLYIAISFPLSLRWRHKLAMPWVRFAIWLVKHVLGIPYRLIGAENMPPHAAIVFSKHQSAWETLVLQEVFKDAVFVWKKEIKKLPFFGWALALTPMIPIDRGAGKEAIKHLVEIGGTRLKEGYTVIIFPEGTRAPPGGQQRYKGGGAFLATATGVPVVPVALNSGEFWGKNALFKKSGIVTVSVGPAIDPKGLSASDILSQAETWIEAEMRRISPQLYRDAKPHEVSAQTPT